MTEKTNVENKMANITFHQKSAGVSLVILGSIGAYTAARFVNMAETQSLSQSANRLPEGFLSFALIVFSLIILLEIVLQIVLVIGAGGVPDKNSLDQKVNWMSNQTAYWVLIGGALVTFGSVFFQATPFLMANIALFSLLLSEIVKYASQLILYPKAG